MTKLFYIYIVLKVYFEAKYKNRIQYKSIMVVVAGDILQWRPNLPATSSTPQNFPSKS